MTECRQWNVASSAPECGHAPGTGLLARRGPAHAIALSTLAFVLGCDIEPTDRREPLEQPRAAVTTGAPHSDVEAPRARAMLESTQGSEARGHIDFTTGAHGVLIEAELTGLEPGTHGIHIHEFGDCSAPDGSSMGDHFTPETDPHGAPGDEPEAHHAGDLGNVTADDSGNARKEMGDVELTIDEGEFGVIGRAVVVHSAEDDLTTQPSGDSGDPVACGVIEFLESETLDRG